MKIHKKNLITLLIVILPIVIMGLLCEFLIPEVPKTAQTKGTIYTLRKRIRKYVKLNNDIPQDLSNLPVIESYGNETEDAWGNDIIYEVNGSEVTLTSLGQDGKAGGDGEDEDLTGKFIADGNLNEPFCVVLFSQSMTYDIMSSIATRIQLYVSNNGHLPDDLSNLPELKLSPHDNFMESLEFLNKTIDHWGKDIIFQRISPTKFQLFSYGEDLKEGGIGQYSDMERIFELNDKGECVEIHFNFRDK